MLFNVVAALAVLAGTSVAQRPSNTSICDYYTMALLKNNTAASQYALLTQLVNTAVIGNYTMPNMNAVPGILAQGQSYNGTPVNLLPYFSGALASSNRGGSAGVSVNFLDGGGAAPLMMNMPANSTSSNQYKLLTHLYEFFGTLLGCTQYGMGAFPAYDGQGSMYKVHKFMDLDAYEVGYFIQQVGLAAASFGVATADVQAAGMSLNKLFGYRCSPPATAVMSQGPQLQSICDAPACPLDPMANCGLEDNNGTSPMPMNASSMAGGSPTSTSGMPTATFKGAASQMGASLTLVVAVALAFCLS